MIDSATAIQIAKLLHGMVDEVDEDGYILRGTSQGTIKRLADAIEANEKVTSGIDVMRYVREYSP